MPRGICLLGAALTFAIIQDLSKIKDLATAVGVTCPNCGAPITGLGSKFCEYCGTGVTPVDTRVWKLHRVEGENH